MPNLQYLSHAMKSDEELSRLANQRYEALFLGELEAARRSAEGQAGRIRQSLSALDPQYEGRIGAVQDLYKQQKQNISDTTMARGFGRSSYTTDMLQRADIRMAADIDALTREKAGRIDALNQEIGLLYAQLDETQGRLTVEKQNRILSAIEDMRAEQERERQNVLKYNNELTLKEAEAQARQEREAREYQLALDKFEREQAWKQQDMEFQNYWNQQNLSQKQAEAAMRQRQIEGQMQMAMMEYALKEQAAQRQADEWEYRVQQDQAAADAAMRSAAIEAAMAANAGATAAASGAFGAGGAGAMGGSGGSGAYGASGSSGSSSSKSSGSSGSSQTSASKGSSGSSKGGSSKSGSGSSGSSKGSTSPKSASGSSGAKAGSASSGSGGTTYTASPANAFLFNEVKAQLDRYSKQQALSLVQTDPKYKQLGGDYYKLLEYVRNR